MAKRDDGLILPDRHLLRKKLLERRRQVQIDAPAIVDLINGCVTQFLLERSFLVAGFYRPIKSEPDLTPSLQAWAAADSARTLCVPVIDDSKQKRMHYGIWREEDVRIGPYGIEEPLADVPITPQVIFAPCVGVTAEGFRLGNGGGFFDRWLSDRRRAGDAPVTVAVAFDCLLTREFVPEDHDEPMDWILTESGFRRAQ